MAFTLNDGSNAVERFKQVRHLFFVQVQDKMHGYMIYREIALPTSHAERVRQGTGRAWRPSISPKNWAAAFWTPMDQVG